MAKKPKKKAKTRPPGFLDATPLGGAQRIKDAAAALAAVNKKKKKKK